MTIDEISDDSQAIFNERVFLDAELPSVILDQHGGAVIQYHSQRFETLQFYGYKHSEQ